MGTIAFYLLFTPMALAFQCMVPEQCTENQNNLVKIIQTVEKENYQGAMRELLSNKVDKQLAFYEALGGNCTSKGLPRESCFKKNEIFDQMVLQYCHITSQNSFKAKLQKVGASAKKLRCQRNSAIIIHRLCQMQDVKPIFTPQFVEVSQDCADSNISKVITLGQQKLSSKELLEKAQIFNCRNFDPLKANEIYQRFLLKYPMFEPVKPLTDYMNEDDVFNAQFVPSTELEDVFNKDTELKATRIRDYFKQKLIPKFGQVYSRVCSMGEHDLAKLRPLATELLSMKGTTHLVAQDCELNNENRFIKDLVNPVKLAGDACAGLSLPFMWSLPGQLAGSICGGTSVAGSSALWFDDHELAHLAEDGRGVLKNDTLSTANFELTRQVDDHLKDMAMEASSASMGGFFRFFKKTPKAKAALIEVIQEGRKEIPDTIPVKQSEVKEAIEKLIAKEKIPSPVPTLTVATKPIPKVNVRSLDLYKKTLYKTQRLSILSGPQKNQLIKRLESAQDEAQIIKIDELVAYIKENEAYFVTKGKELLKDKIPELVELKEARVKLDALEIERIEALKKIEAANKEARRLEVAKRAQSYTPETTFSRKQTPAETQDFKELHVEFAKIRPSKKDKLKQIEELKAWKPTDLAQKLEKEAALALYEKFPDNWAYANRKYFDYELSPRADPRGKIQFERIRYETDIELNCCIVEVTKTKPEYLGQSKYDQLRRYLNKEGRFDFINPDKKKVILYAPYVPERPDWLDKDVVLVRTLKELEAAVGSATKSKVP